MEFVQIILVSLIAILVSAMFVGSLVMAGSWCWYHWIILVMVLLTGMLVKLAIKEYKQSKQ